jgi:tetratricopeptide (TPR) repeat protein
MKAQSIAIASAVALWLLPGLSGAVPIGIAKDLQDALVLPRTRAEEIFRIQPQGLSANELLAKALQSINAGRPQEAIGPLKDYVKADATSAPARELLGAAYALDGKLDQALVELREAIRLNPKQATAYTKIADVLLAQGKRDAALSMLLKAVEIAPNDRLPHQRLGLLYESAGKTADAVRHYERGIRGSPAEYLGVKLNLARLYNAGGHYAKTKELLDAAGPATQRSADALVLLGTADLALGRVDDALRRFESARRLEPKDPGGHLGLGIALREKRDYGASAQALSQVVRLRPQWSTGHFQLAETYFAQRRHKEALSSFQRAAQLNPDSHLVRKRIADSQAGLGNWDAAIDLYRSLARVPAMAPSALAGLGTVYQLKGEAAKAQGALEELVRRAPKDPDAYRLLGQHFAARGDYAQGIAVFRKGLALDPKNGPLLTAQVVAYSRAGDARHALQHAEALVQARPQDPDAHFLLGSLHDEAGRSTAAVSAYRKALALDSQHLATLNNLAMALANAGNAAEGLRIAAQARELAPDDPFIQATYAWTLLKARRTQEAVKLLQQSAQALPNDPSILYHLGSAYAEAGDTQRARSTLSEALRLSTRFKEASATKKLLERL